MRVLIQAVGSAGDVYPFVALGRTLAARGHEVTLLTSAIFQGVVAAAGLRFVELGTVAEYRALTENPDLWHPRKGLELVVRAGLLRRLPEATEVVLDEVRGGLDVLVGSTLAFPARIAREVLGVPLVVAHLAPCAFQSSERPPLFRGSLLSARAPAVWNRLQWALMDWLTDRMARPGVEAVRGKHGLPPVRRIFYGWMSSADALLALFPAWFAPPQRDWPRGVVQVGFPRGDEAGTWTEDPALEAWLAGGQAPLLFTAGSANRHGAEFYRESLEAAHRLGRRALLVTRARALLPAHLPEWARHVEYVPFARLLPRVAALVSHGGIGTCAEGLAAGVPQLVRPLGFDQLDNASRLVELGVGTVVEERAYTGRRVAERLGRLLESAGVARAVASARARMAADPPLAAAAELVETVARRSPARAGAPPGH